MDSQINAIPPDMSIKMLSHRVLNWLSGPGLPIILLIAFAIYSNGQTREMKKDLRNCQDNTDQIYLTIIQQNTEALKHLEATLNNTRQ